MQKSPDSMASTYVVGSCSHRVFNEQKTLVPQNLHWLPSTHRMNGNELSSIRQTSVRIASHWDIRCLKQKKTERARIKIDFFHIHAKYFASCEALLVPFNKRQSRFYYRLESTKMNEFSTINRILLILKVDFCILCLHTFDCGKFAVVTGTRAHTSAFRSNFEWWQFSGCSKSAECALPQFVIVFVWQFRLVLRPADRRAQSS